MSEVAQDETMLRLERLIPSPPERLFALWTQPAQLARWWAPPGYEADVAVMEVRPGGSWRTVLTGPDGRTAAMGGVYRVVEAPRRLAFTWTWDGDGQETEVTATFEPAPGGTRVTVTHARFVSRAERDRHERGWGYSLGVLATLAG